MNESPTMVTEPLVGPVSMLNLIGSPSGSKADNVPVASVSSSVVTSTSSAVGAPENTPARGNAGSGVPSEVVPATNSTVTAPPKLISSPLD